jgi:hypothetical protein
MIITYNPILIFLYPKINNIKITKTDVCELNIILFDIYQTI